MSPTVTVTVTDTNGNTSAPASASWTVAAPTTGQPWMGSSVPSNQNQGGYQQWDYVRIYDFGTNGSEAIAAFNDHGVRGMGISDSGITPSTSPTSVASQVRALLIGFYEGSGSAARQDVELHVALENEYGDHITTGNLSNWIAQHAAAADTILEMQGGVRRFPKASLWADPTHYQEQRRAGGSNPLPVTLDQSLHPIARHLMRTGGGVAWSMYVPGRESTVNDPTFDKPTTLEADRYNLNKGYITRCYMRTRDARTQGRTDLGDPTAAMRIACWEIGIGNDPNDNDHRPYFVVHSLVDTNLTLSQTYSLPIAALTWWDQQLTKDGELQSDNPFSHEPTATNPSTAYAWRNALSMDHRRGGSHAGTSWPNNPKSSWPTGA